MARRPPAGWSRPGARPVRRSAARGRRNTRRAPHRTVRDRGTDRPRAQTDRRFGDRGRSVCVRGRPEGRRCLQPAPVWVAPSSRARPSRRRPLRPAARSPSAWAHALATRCTRSGDPVALGHQGRDRHRDAVGGRVERGDLGGCVDAAGDPRAGAPTWRPLEGAANAGGPPSPRRRTRMSSGDPARFACRARPWPRAPRAERPPRRRATSSVGRSLSPAPRTARSSRRTPRRTERCAPLRCTSAASSAASRVLPIPDGPTTSAHP